MAINQIIDKDAIQQQINALIQSLEQSKSAIDTNVKSTGDLIDAEKKLAIEMKAMEQIQRQLIVAETKLNASQGDFGKQMMKVRTETRELNAELQREARLQKELKDSIASGAESMEDAATSIGSMQRKLAILNDEYSKLSDKQRKGDTGKKLAADITSLNKDLAIANSTSQGFFKMWKVTVKESFANAGNMFIGAAQGTVTLSTAMKALGAAMKSLLRNPLMLMLAALAAAIGPLVNKFKEWRKEVKENKEAQKELQVELMKTTKHTKELQQATDNAIKSGKSWKEVKEHIEAYKKALEDLDGAEQTLQETIHETNILNYTAAIENEKDVNKRKKLYQDLQDEMIALAKKREQAELDAVQAKYMKEKDDAFAGGWLDVLNKELDAATDAIELKYKTLRENIVSDTDTAVQQMIDDGFKAYAEAELAIRKLRIENSNYQGKYKINQYSNEVELLRIAYEQDLKNFKGTEEQKTEYAIEREVKFQADVLKIWNKMRSERIKLIGDTFDNEEVQIEVIKNKYSELAVEFEKTFKNMNDPKAMKDILLAAGFEEEAIIDMMAKADEAGNGTLDWLKLYNAYLVKNQEARDKEIQNLKDGNVLKQLEKDLYTDQTQLTEQYIDSLKQVNKLYNSNEISIEEYYERLLHLDDMYTTQSLESQKSSIEKTLELEKLSEAEQTKLKKQLLDIILKLDTDNANKLIANKEKLKAENIKSVTDTVNTITSVAQTAMNVMSSISDVYFNQIEKQLESLNSLRDESQRAFDFQMELLDKLNLSDEERSLRQRELLAEKYADELRYSKKQLELKQKQAKFDKATGITNATISMGLAIMNAVVTGMKSPYGFMVPLLVGIATATGLAQIAAIASQPIPQYEKGGRIDTSGPVLWGEKKSEVAVEPGGNVVVSSAPEVRSFKPGTMIYPSIDKFNKSVARQRNFVGENNAFVFDDSRLLEAIVNNKSDVRINIDENGIISLLNKSNNRTKYINKRMSL